MFSPKTPNERESFAFDYDGLLPPGETIISATFLIHLQSDLTKTDIPAMHPLTPLIDGELVHIFIVGGVAETIYCAEMEAVTSPGGQHLILKSDLLVTEYC